MAALEAFRLRQRKYHKNGLILMMKPIMLLIGKK